MLIFLEIQDTVDRESLCVMQHLGEESVVKTWFLSMGQNKVKTGSWTKILGINISTIPDMFYKPINYTSNIKFNS